MKLSRKGILVSALPSLIILTLFYSLALHMYYSLGQWPTSIGEFGFPAALVTHAKVAANAVMVMIPFSVLVLPVACVLSLSVPRWRRFSAYIVICGVAILLACGLMLLAPEPYLTWWKD